MIVFNPHGRVAQRESPSLTHWLSLVQSQPRSNVKTSFSAGLFHLKRILGLKRAVGGSTASEASRPDTGLPGGGRQSQPRMRYCQGQSHPRSKAETGPCGRSLAFESSMLGLKRAAWFIIGKGIKQKGTISIKSKKIVPFLRKNGTKNDNYQKIVPIRSGQSH